MSFVSYAQNFEDVRLLRAFSDVQTGRYLDIGTQDPLQDSVSFAFYERGWRGVHVEPTPEYAAAMRSARPDELVIEAAVSSKSGPLIFYEIPGTGLSTGIRDIAELHAASGLPYQVIKVHTITLADIFNKMGNAPIHWLKIDVEGMEADVLASWGDHPTRPGALVIEATAPNTQNPTHTAWYDLVTQRGYTDVLFDGLSRYFIHTSQGHRADALALSPNIFDQFQVTSAHFAAHKLKNDHERHISEIQERTSPAAQEKWTALEVRLATTENLLDEARANLDEFSARVLVAVREAANLEGRLVAQAETHIAELATAASTAEAIRQDLVARLAQSEAALSVTRANAMRLQTEIDELQRNFATVQSKQANTITKLEWQVQRLSSDTDKLIDQLADTNNRLQQEVRLHLEARESAASERARSQVLCAEIEYLRGVSGLQTLRLAQASALLAGRGDPLAGWPLRFATWLAKLTGRLDEEAIKAHAIAIDNWHKTLDLLDATAIREAGISAAGSMPEPKVTSDDGNLTMAQSEAPDTSLEQLLAQNDQAFISSAYQEVLGRAPDPEGNEYYLTRLRSGISKLAILKQLRKSSEGQSTSPRIPEIDLAIKRYSLANLPLAGVLFRLVTGAETDNPMQRRLNILTNEIAILRSAKFQIHETQPTDELKSETQTLPVNVIQQNRQNSVPKLRLQPQLKINSENHYRTTDFLSLYDENFIVSVYLALLQRPPDAAGKSHYLKKLRDGESKIRILYDVANSIEARKKKSVVFDIRKAYLLDRFLHLPVLGNILQATIFVTRVGDHMRDLRALENHVFRLAEETYSVHRAELAQIRDELERRP